MHVHVSKQRTKRLTNKSIVGASTQCGLKMIRRTRLPLQAFLLSAAIWNDFRALFDLRYWLVLTIKAFNGNRVPTQTYLKI
jgi:hypothetical protein